MEKRVTCKEGPAAERTAPLLHKSETLVEIGGAVEEMEGGGHSSDFRNYKGTENQQKRQREKESPPHF